MKCNMNTRKCGTCGTVVNMCSRPNCEGKHPEFVDKAMNCTHKPENLRDWRGTPITVGAHIVYPGRASSSIWMTESIVRAFKRNEPSYHQDCVTYTLMVEHVATTRWTFDDGKPKKPRLYPVDPGLVTVVPQA